MGWKASTVPVFAAEIAPAHLRGTFAAASYDQPKQEQADSVRIARNELASF
jgi:hypothetical protein